MVAIIAEAGPAEKHMLEQLNKSNVKTEILLYYTSLWWRALHGKWSMQHQTSIADCTAIAFIVFAELRRAGDKITVTFIIISNLGQHNLLFYSLC